MRTLDQLMAADTTARPPEIHVSPEEARLLVSSGASVSNGLRCHTDGEGGDLTQRYRLDDKVFLWVETAGDQTSPVQ